MTPQQFARVEAITKRLHEKRHRGWNCDDMHGLVHKDHMDSFRRIAVQIVEKETGLRVVR